VTDAGMGTAGQQYDIVVIGGGPGGYATALYGAAAGLSIAIVERDLVGGTCLHRGCVPAKEFLETAAVYRTVRQAGEFGVITGEREPLVDFSVSQARKGQVVNQLFRGLAGLLKGRKVTTLSGTGALLPDHRVRVVDGDDAGTEVVGRHVVLAPGSVPRSLPGLEVDGRLVLTSDEFLDLDRVPPSVVVVGGGAIGCEFASLLADLGSKVTIVEALDSIVSYLRTLPPDQQVDPGLTWVDGIVAGRYDRFSGQTWHLATWLSELRGAVPKSGEPLRQFRSIVDGLASAGDDRFVAIQRAEEGPEANN